MPVSTTPVQVTMWTVPGAPTGVSAAPVGETPELGLSWTAPSNTGGTGATITGYKVRWRVKDTAPGTQGDQPGVTWNADAGVDASGTSLTASGLDSDTTYEVEVRALNGIDPGSAWSAAGEGTTPEVAAPSVPRNVQATPGDGKITLTWQAPSSWGDWTAHSFRVEWKLSSASDASWATAASPFPDTTSYVFTGTIVDTTRTVTNGTAYDLRVRAESQQPGTDGTEDSHYLRSAWVEVSNQVPDVSTTVSLSANRNPVGEGNRVRVTATLSRARSSNVTIPFSVTAVSPDTAEAGDYTTTTTSIVIPSGWQFGSALIQTNHDTDADDETFTVSLDTANLPPLVTAGSPSSVRIRIADDEGPPQVTLHVTRNPVTEGRVTMVEARLTKGGRAFRPVGGSTARIRLLVRRGTLETGDVRDLLTLDTQQTDSVPIPIYGSSWRGTFSTYQIRTASDRDADNETFTVELAPLPSGYVRGDPAAVVITIRDPDTLRELWLRDLRLRGGRERLR